MYKKGEKMLTEQETMDKLHKTAEEFAKGTPFDIIMQKYNGEVAL